MLTPRSRVSQVAQPLMAADPGDLKELRQLFEGARFGRLTVCADAPRVGGHRRVHVRCECGSEKTVRLDHVLAGRTRSCGCLNAEMSAQRVDTRITVRHGANRRGHRAPEYQTWSSMIQRCTNPRRVGYKNWGGRGIQVCEKWRLDFRAFLADMGPRPGVGYSIDRINNGGHYEPGNVRWATRHEQNLNRRPRGAAA